MLLRLRRTESRLFDSRVGNAFFRNGKRCGIFCFVEKCLKERWMNMEGMMYTVGGCKELGVLGVLQNCRFL